MQRIPAPEAFEPKPGPASTSGETPASFLLQRQSKPKGAALPQFAVNANFAVVAFNDLGADVQPQPEAGVLVACIVGTVITAE